MLLRSRLYIGLLLNCLLLASQGFVDKSSFIITSTSRKLFDEGVHRRLGGSYERSLSLFEQSYQLLPLKVTAFEIANCYMHLEQWNNYQSWTNTVNGITYTQNSKHLAEDCLRQSRVCYIEGDINRAVQHASSACKQDPKHVYAAYLLGVYLQHIGDTIGAIDAYTVAIALSPRLAQGRINAAAMHQGVNQLSEAIVHYRYMLDQVFGPVDTGTDLYCMAKANLGVAYFQTGQQGKAITELRELSNALINVIITKCPMSAMLYPWMKHTTTARATQSNNVNIESEWRCNEYMDNLGVTMTHLTTVKKSICDWQYMELDVFGFLLPVSLHNYGLSIDHPTPIHHTPFGPILPFDSLLLPLSLTDRLRIAHTRSRAVQMASPYINNTVTTGSVLSIHVHSSGISSGDGELTLHRSSHPLRLGFISYDFNDHPTAHLVEALFETVVECRQAATSITASTTATPSLYATSGGMCHDVQMGILNYGPNDNSEYRQRLQAKADSVYDIAVESHQSSAQWIQRDKVDILLDMQLHTLGNRAELIAAHPAPLVVNYLVYPGTCGSSHHEYIVADRIVVPPEHAIHYSERLLLLPPSYQISTYRNINASRSITSSGANHGGISSSGGRSAGRRDISTKEQDDLTSVVKLCNFNKIDKLDVESFTLWMQIMRRYPGSKLQLLDPVKRKVRDVDTGDREEGSSSSSSGSTDHDQSLYSSDSIAMQMKYHGVYTHHTMYRNGTSSSSSSNALASNARLEIVPRMTKEMHIKRQGHGSDLFLDTVVYGAHSTATDALRAGLPVLTIAGGSFPSRVAASLYASFDNSSSGTKENRPIDIDGSALTTEDQLPTPYTLTDMLVGYSQKEFEDMAIRLMTKKDVLRRLKNELTAKVVSRGGIFNSAMHTFNFLHGMESIAEIRTLFPLQHGNLANRTYAQYVPHVVFTNTRLLTKDTFTSRNSTTFQTSSIG